jgi:hypothetical protein
VERTHHPKDPLGWQCGMSGVESDGLHYSRLYDGVVGLVVKELE